MSAEFFPRWEEDGFSGPPEVFVARGAEIILRAYAPTIDPEIDVLSEQLARFFFVPAGGAIAGPIQGFSIDAAAWTGAFLERRLNAFVFGNSYERIGVWALQPDVPYQIGGIGFDTRTVKEVGPWREPYPRATADSSQCALYRHRRAAGDDPLFFRQVMLTPQLPAWATKLPWGDPRRKKAFRHAMKRLVRPVDDFAVLMPLRPSATRH